MADIVICCKIWPSPVVINDAFSDFIATGRGVSRVFHDMLTSPMIKTVLQKNGYVDSVICLHSSLKSFGAVANGPRTIIDGFLEAGNTILAPAFYYASETTPTIDNYQQNGIEYTDLQFFPVGYTGLAEQIDCSMGIIPKTMLTYRNACRSSHPMNSFVAIGPKAEKLCQIQGNLNVYSVYKHLLAENQRSYIFHCGTKLTTCTPLHFAEEAVGRIPFRRWVLNYNNTEEIEVGGCSAGFENLRPFLNGIEHKIVLGSSPTSVFAFEEFIERAVERINKMPDITKCSDSCIVCNHAIAGGPKLEGTD